MDRDEARPPWLDDYCGPTSVGGFFYGPDSIPAVQLPTYTSYIQPAVTPRVYLAGQAMCGMLARDNYINHEMIGDAAVRYADAALARLEEPK